MGVMTITYARTHLSELADRVQAGEEVAVTRHGKPVMVAVRPDDNHKEIEEIDIVYPDEL